MGGHQLTVYLQFANIFPALPLDNSMLYHSYLVHWNISILSNNSSEFIELALNFTCCLNAGDVM